MSNGKKRWAKNKTTKGGECVYLHCCCQGKPTHTSNLATVAIVVLFLVCATPPDSLLRTHSRSREFCQQRGLSRRLYRGIVHSTDGELSDVRRRQAAVRDTCRTTHPSIPFNPSIELSNITSSVHRVSRIVKLGDAPWLLVENLSLY